MSPIQTAEILCTRLNLSKTYIRCNHILVSLLSASGRKQEFKERSFDFTKCSHKDEGKNKIPFFFTRFSKKFPYSL